MTKAPKKKSKWIRVRHTDTGLYSVGGGWPQFSRNGKTWMSEGNFKSHLAMVVKSRLTYAEQVAAVPLSEKLQKVYGNCIVERISTDPWEMETFMFSEYCEKFVQLDECTL